MKKQIVVIFFVLLIAFLLLGCSKDEPTQPSTKTSYLKYRNCKEVYIEDCNSLSLKYSEWDDFGRPTVIEYSGCGKSGKARVTYNALGCITSISEM
jgi:hypothetical protein